MRGACAAIRADRSDAYTSPTMALDWIYYLLLAILLVFGLFINILGLPGLWLMIAAAAAYAWATGGVHLYWHGLIALLVLAILAEVAEFVAGAAGSKAAGGSKRGMLGAIVGGIVGGILGTPLFPVIGTIFGACLGAFVGAFVVEVGIGRDPDEATQIGWGAFKGRFWGIVVKLGFGFVMLVVGLVTALPTGTRPAATAATPLPAPGTQPATLPTTLPTTAPTLPPATAPVTSPTELKVERE